jgi:hypothetical protein
MLFLVLDVVFSDVMLIMHPLNMLDEIPVTTVKASVGVGTGRSEYPGVDGC